MNWQALFWASVSLAAGFVGMASGVRGQQAGGVPPVRQLGRRIAVIQVPLGSASDLRQLSNGSLLINDVAKHQLLLLDSTLAHARVIADSTRGTNNAYGSERGGLVPYLGDTTLFADGQSVSLLVIAPDGRIVRVIAPPHPADLGSLIPYIGGRAGLDAQGRLVYKITGWSVGTLGPGSVEWPDEGSGIIAARHGLNLDGTPSLATVDSVPVVRADLATHATDTVGFVLEPRSPLRYTTAPDGSKVSASFYNPMPRGTDEFAILTDGSIAFVRAWDYHVDWVNPDGTLSSTPKMAHEWYRLTDSAKAAIVDSVRADFQAMIDHNDSLDRARGRPLNQKAHVARVVDPSDLVDYAPPFGNWNGSPAVMADADNELWIRQGAKPPSVTLAELMSGSAPPRPPPIYDIVNRAGQVIDRVQLPPSLTLVGFGPGVVYLSVREGTGTVVAKYRIH